MASYSYSRLMTGQNSSLQKFNYYLIIDIQATCEKHEKPQLDPREIIEISVIKVDSKTFQIEANFHQYVYPRKNKILTPFCIKLTGISQSMVDGQLPIDRTLQRLDSWLHDQELFKPGVTFAFVTHSDWALRTVLSREFGSTPIPEYFRKWISIPKIFQKYTGLNKEDELDPLTAMLKVFDLKIEGPRHGGVYVCNNVLQLMKALDKQKQAEFVRE